MSAKPLSKNILRILERPYCVTTPSGDHLYFSSQAEAHLVSNKCSWIYSVYNIQARSWVPIGIIWYLPK